MPFISGMAMSVIFGEVLEDVRGDAGVDAGDDSAGKSCGTSAGASGADLADFEMSSWGFCSCALNGKSVNRMSEARARIRLLISYRLY
jgi:hypothetical protein